MSARRRRSRARERRAGATAVAEPAPDVVAASAAGDVPIFSDRLTTVLETVLAGQAPNAGRFCDFCYSPVDLGRKHCRHCRREVKESRLVARVPDEVFLMFRRMRRRESLVVNSFAYLGLALAMLVFVVLTYVILANGANFWWFVVNIALLFVLARVLAGLLGGFVGDELGYRHARRKLAQEWAAYESQRGNVSC